MMGGMFQVFDWIAKFAVVNVLWLIFNCPIVLVLLNMMIIDNQSHSFLSIMVVVALTPFILFPSTAAMFSSIRDWIIEKEVYSLLKAFWIYYKENYKRSMLAGLFLTSAWVVVIGDIYYFSEESTTLMFAFLVLGVLLFAYTVNLFSVMAHFDVKLSLLLKKALLLTVARPMLSVIIIVSTVIVVYVSVNSLPFLVPFFSGSLITFVSFSAFYKIYEKITATRSQ